MLDSRGKKRMIKSCKNCKHRKGVSTKLLGVKEWEKYCKMCMRPIQRDILVGIDDCWEAKKNEV